MRPQRNQNQPYYAYCIFRLDPDQEWKVFPGIGERAVFPVREGRLAMLVSRLDGNFTTDAHSIIQHGRVVHRVFERCTVLPFRFGTTFATEQQIRHVLLANRTEFLEAMNRLRGKAEMHVKLLFTASAPEGELVGEQPQGQDSGAEFVRRAAERVAGLFRPLDEQVSVRPLQSGDWLVDFAHLIEDSRVAAYQRIGSSAAERMNDCQLLVSGPWPPYHFLPSAIRIPAASEAHLYAGRRTARRTTAAPQARSAKA